jgi:outer membrane protein OmpU
MNKLKKIGLSALAGSLVAISANAVEVSISGGATMYMSKGAETTATGLSMSDSVTFTTSGTTNGGIDVSISLELDGDAANDVLDSKSIKFGTDDLGTVTFAGHGGSSVMGGMDDKTPNAYEEVWDGVTGADTDVIGGHGGNNLLRYDSPSFAGVTAHASYQDAGTDSAVAGSEKVSTYSDFGITIAPEAFPDLEIGMAQGNYSATASLDGEESTIYVSYNFGENLSVAYQTSEIDLGTSANTDESEAFGISYTWDDISVSYGTHTIDYGSGTTDQEAKGFSASYTMGGMTIAGMQNTVDNVGGSTDASNDKEGYEISLSFAF